MSPEDEPGITAADESSPKQAGACRNMKRGQKPTGTVRYEYYYHGSVHAGTICFSRLLKAEFKNEIERRHFNQDIQDLFSTFFFNSVFLNAPSWGGGNKLEALR